ncbi:MAG: hypothetical protein WA954_00905 [Parerythrobacter sp.]
MLFDSYFAEAYSEIDPDCDRIRIAARRIAIASMLDVSIDDLGKISVGRLRTYTTEHQDEAAMLAAVFDDLRASGNSDLITYGGSAVDAKVVELAAMQHDLALPPQLKQAFGPRKEHPAHLDLSAQMKGFGKTWHHLSEVMIRMGLPVALLRNKGEPCFRHDQLNWKAGVAHCELDTLLTAIALIAWRRVQGAAGLRIPGAKFALIEGFLRQRPDATFAPILRGEQQELLEAIADEFAEAA